MRETLQFVTVPLIATLVVVGAEDSLPDKAQYHLFQATPRESLREMSTDRPDKTESPYTVDAGHFQVELDLVTYSHDHDTFGGADIRVEAWSIAPINLKVGLRNDLDLQLVIATWNRVRTTDRGMGTTQRQSGFGDLTVRLKKNFWGNDGGTTAFGIMPFVKFPTNQDHLGNQAVEGGVIFPLAFDLPMGWSLGAMTEVDLRRNSNRGGDHAAVVNSITFGHSIIGHLNGYAEFFSEVSTEADSRWVGTVDVGLTYALTANCQLDAGVNIGVTRSADDWNPFVGLSARF